MKKTRPVPLKTLQDTTMSKNKTASASRKMEKNSLILEQKQASASGPIRATPKGCSIKPDVHQ